MLKAATTNRRQIRLWNRSRPATPSPYVNGVASTRARAGLGSIQTTRSVQNGKLTVTDTHRNLFGRAVGTRRKVYRATGDRSRPWRAANVVKSGTFGSKRVRTGPWKRLVVRGKGMVRRVWRRSMLRAATTNRRQIRLWNRARPATGSPYVNGVASTRARAGLGSLQTTRFVQNGKLTVTDTHRNLFGRTIGTRRKVYRATGDRSRPWRVAGVEKSGTFGSRRWRRPAARTPAIARTTSPSVKAAPDQPRRRMIPLISVGKLRALGGLLTGKTRAPQISARQAQRDYRAGVVSNLSRAPKRRDTRGTGHYYRKARVPDLGDVLRGRTPRTIDVTRKDAYAASSRYSPRYTLQVRDAAGRKRARVELSSREFKKLLSTRVKLADALVKLDGKRLAPERLPPTRRQRERRHQALVRSERKTLRRELLDARRDTRTMDRLARQYARLGTGSGAAGEGLRLEVKRMERMVARGHAKPHQREFLRRYGQHRQARDAQLRKEISNAARRNLRRSASQERPPRSSSRYGAIGDSPFPAPRERRPYGWREGAGRM
jgi:hypothetical protein